MTKRVLVTGASGFTGRYVVREMQAAGWDVWGSGRADSIPGLSYRQAELGDARSVASLLEEVQPEAIIHLAAQAFVAADDVDAMYCTNLLGTRHLLQAAAEVVQTPPFVLLASSANVYGNAGDTVIRESQPAIPANDYAVGKLAMEHMARLWMDRLPIAITRPFNYTGVGQSPRFLIAKLVAHLRDGAREIELGNLEIRRDITDVRAVAEAYRRLLEARPAGETVQICSGESHTLREMLAMAEEIAGHHLKVSVSPGLVRKNEITSLRGDPSRLRELIGDWRSPSLRETLTWMLQA